MGQTLPAAGMDDTTRITEPCEGATVPGDPAALAGKVSGASSLGSDQVAPRAVTMVSE